MTITLTDSVNEEIEQAVSLVISKLPQKLFTFFTTTHSNGDHPLTTLLSRLVEQLHHECARLLQAHKQLHEIDSPRFRHRLHLYSPLGQVKGSLGWLSEPTVHGWRWLQCDSATQVLLPPGICAKWCSLVKKRNHTVSAEVRAKIDRAQHELIRQCLAQRENSRHPFCGLKPTHGRFALPWNFSITVIDELIVHFATSTFQDDTTGARPENLLKTSRLGTLTPPDSTGRRWVLANDGHQYCPILLTPNLSSQFLLLITAMNDVVFNDSFRQPHSQKLFTQLLQRFLKYSEPIGNVDAPYRAILDPTWKSSNLAGYIEKYEKYLAKTYRHPHLEPLFVEQEPSFCPMSRIEVMRHFEDFRDLNPHGNPQLFTPDLTPRPQHLRPSVDSFYLQPSSSSSLVPQSRDVSSPSETAETHSYKTSETLVPTQQPEEEEEEYDELEQLHMPTPGSSYAIPSTPTISPVRPISRHSQAWVTRKPRVVPFPNNDHGFNHHGRFMETKGHKPAPDKPLPPLPTHPHVRDIWGAALPNLRSRLSPRPDSLPSKRDTFRISEVDSHQYGVDDTVEAGSISSYHIDVEYVPNDISFAETTQTQMLLNHLDDILEDHEDLEYLDTPEETQNPPDHYAAPYIQSDHPWYPFTTDAMIQQTILSSPHFHAFTTAVSSQPLQPSVEPPSYMRRLAKRLGNVIHARKAQQQNQLLSVDGLKTIIVQVESEETETWDEYEYVMMVDTDTKAFRDYALGTQK